MPWLQGPKKARQHPQFAHDLAAKYPDHPLAKVSGATLMKKFKDGNRGLRLRDEASADEVLQLKAHEEGELVMCLSPFGVLCKTKGAGHDCPPGGLWSVEQFRLHQHAGKTVLKENEKEAALELVKEKGKSKEEYERQQELLEALISTQYTGDPSLVS
ncbi:hypothetical protein AAVH_31780 [Aphelenchoides avenae]|nr:hypothetical protein AAVH_31780 [Aphelenchus avenae]